MSIANEIVSWASHRPRWQQHALHQIATGVELSVSDVATSLVDGTSYRGSTLSAADLPRSVVVGDPVRLLSVSPISHVNALRNGESLTFSPTGLTVIYGDNGSGKSGYARLIKQVVRARVREDILTNVFEDLEREKPSASISYTVGQEVRAIKWPEEPARALGDISFYDVDCGASYVATDAAVSYRPSLLTLFDQLISLCDGVREELSKRLVENNAGRIELPRVAEGTKIHEFLSNLSATTTETEIDRAITLPDAVDEEMDSLRMQETRARLSDPTKERVRLEKLSASLSVVKNHLNELERSLGESAATSLVQARQSAAEYRAAANAASAMSFASEPLAGVGSASWRVMWDAAREYSVNEAYVGRDFPSASTGDRCVLCQQPLDSGAEDRLNRFHKFMEDKTESLAKESQEAFDALLAKVRETEPETTAVAIALLDIIEQDSGVVERARSAIEAFTSRRASLLMASSGGEEKILGTPKSQDMELSAMIDATNLAASQIDEVLFNAMLKGISERREELEGRVAANVHRSDIIQEVARLAERSKIEEAKNLTDTSQITLKSTQLAREFVTTVLLDRFTRESQGLRVERVTLVHPSGRKGQLIQRAQLQAARQEVDIPKVLSEGEQSALGLAGFFTEAYFDETKSAVVLDDPVTSLDHVRRSHVSSRLCELAKDRQVVVFTHDLSFVGDLFKAAQEIGVEFTERAIERHGDGSIGMCHDRHPWKARDAGVRLAELDANLVAIRKSQSSWDAATYEREVCEWAGKLSETWERVVSMDIVDRIVDRGTSEVRPSMFRVLSQISEGDNVEFQASYGRCSKWARRHDKSAMTNYVPPGIDELQQELELIKNWHRRIQKYTN